MCSTGIATVSARSLTIGLLLACAFVVGAEHAAAEDYPTRPIKLFVGASAGGTTDTIARALAEAIAPALKQPVVIENRPGAGGNLAADAVAKSTPDGYTLLVSFTSHTINATLYPHLPYDPVADFTAISEIATVPSLLVGNPKLPAGDLKGLIDLARAKPDRLTIALGGIGSSLHLASAQLKMMTGVQLLDVPYKGTSPALADVLGGHVDLMFISLVTGTEQVRAGNLRAYGVTSARRQPSFPDLPAIGEIVPGFESSAWFGLFGPANLPGPVTQKLSAVVVSALRDPKLSERLRDEGASAVGSTPSEFAAFVRADIKHWAPIVQQSGAKPD
jgi:tripartite-type tricarboxylate transporter receptor subunit TctC